MSDPKESPKTNAASSKSLIVRFLDFIEWMGNKLPDPAVLFLVGLFAVWGMSAIFSTMTFTETMPGASEPIKVVNLISLEKGADFLSRMVEIFVGFHPLGVVLVALLGVGVAEKSGFINAVLKTMLIATPKSLLTPMLILVAVVSHTAADAGYVLVIPIGGVMFYAAGRHPLAGIAAAFAGVSGGFSANFIPSGIDPLLAGFTQAGAEQVDSAYAVNPLCNIYFTAASSILIVLIGWFQTDWVIEPRLKNTPVDGNPDDMPTLDDLSDAEVTGMKCGMLSVLVGAILLVLWAFPQNSTLRDSLGQLDSYKNTEVQYGIEFMNSDAEANAGEGDASEMDEDLSSRPPKIVSVAGPAKTAHLLIDDLVTKVGSTSVATIREARDAFENLKPDVPVVVAVKRGESEIYAAFEAKPVPGAPMMNAIVPIIFLFFLIPGLVHGYVSGRFGNHRDVVKGMSQTMETMGYYLVLVFFAALFIDAFNTSHIGKLIALKGANFIKESELPAAVTIMGIIFLSAAVNLLVGSASAKWAMLAPIFVPMLMLLGISPEMTQAAYRVGDSTTNIITPMMPYFPLVVVFCQKYVKSTGIGTVAAMMLPFSITFLVTWAIFLLIYWQIGVPLGVDSSYTFSMPT